MKPIRILPLIAVALVSACSTTDEQKPAATVSAPTAAYSPAPVTGSSANMPLTGTTRSPANTAATVAAPTPEKSSVYFAFDEYNLNPKYINVIQDHAKYLRANPSVQARVEGNSDERGSREYNLALGQRRAEAVMKVLNMHGIPADRVEVISLGEERPARIGHDDASWAENRRSDVILKGGK